MVQKRTTNKRIQQKNELKKELRSQKELIESFGKEQEEKDSKRDSEIEALKKEIDELKKENVNKTKRSTKK